MTRAFYFAKAGAATAPARVTSEADDMCRMNRAGWSRDSSRFVILEHCETETAVVAVSRDGVPHTVIREPIRLEVRQDTREDNPSTEVAADGRFVVLVRSSTFRAEDLVYLDLTNGALRVLAAPNGDREVTQPVRTVVLKPRDDIFKARLYVPDRRDPDTRIPLVIATYYSSPALETSTGDELPILPLVKSGVAVVTFDAQDVTDGFYNGDPQWEIARVERPRGVLEELIAQVVKEYGVDPQRVGISGLSYGAEIATYVYWKSNRFRAVSTSGTGPAPSWLPLGGLGYRTGLESRGLGDETAPVWKAMSVTQNARADLPPLLLQTPDSERLTNVEAWYRLRTAGAPVEWWEYSNETHEKLGATDRWLTQQRNYDWFRFWLQDYEDPDAAKAAQYTRWRAMKRK